MKVKKCIACGKEFETNTKRVICYNKHFHKCPVCGKTFELTDNQLHHLLYDDKVYCCSKECKRKQTELTNIKKYGVTAPALNNAVKDKIRLTNQERYNVDWAGSIVNAHQKRVKNIYEKNNGKYFSDEQVKKNIETRYKKNNGNYFSEEALRNIKEKQYKYFDIPMILSYLQDGYSLTSICDILHHDPVVLYKKLEDAGIDYTQYLQVVPLNISKEQLEKDIAELLSTQDIADKYKCSVNTVYNYLNKYNLFKKSYSIQEDFIYLYICSIYRGEVLREVRNIINPYEIDIYMPELNIGIEYNGDYWHNSTNAKLNRDIDYHYRKSKLAAEKGIFIYHIFEYEWKTNKEQILNQLNSLIGHTKKIHAKSCYIKEVSSKECSEFLNANHRQGRTTTQIRLGLYLRHNSRGLQKDELVSLMAFEKGRRNKNYEYELVRFCNKSGYSVLEGASTLFNYFLSEFNPKSIISYSDIATTTGNLYNILGFKYIGDSRGSYIWTDFYKVYRREQCMKKKLPSLFNEDLDLAKTEKQIMIEHGFVQIWNAGVRKHIWKNYIDKD